MMKKLFFTLGLVLMTWAEVNAQTPELKYLYVADEKMKCEIGNTLMACYRVRTHKDSLWRAFPYEIEGFIWEPGVQVYMEVEEYTIAEPKEGEPNKRYKFIKAIESRNMVLTQTELLAKNRWKLINIQILRDMVPNVRKMGAYVEFFSDSNYATGFSGCNQFYTGASYKEGNINFFKFSSTLKSCGNDSLEKLFISAFNGETHFYFKNNMLFLVGSNSVILHFRPERRIDSLVNELQMPRISRGNHYKVMPDGKFSVVLDDEKEAGYKTFIFTNAELNAKEKATVIYRLINLDPNDQIAEIQVLKLSGKKKGFSKAILILKDGTRRNTEIRNVN